MARRYGWAPRGERCRIAVPAGHWKTTTVIAGLRTSGLSATALLDGPVTGERFRAYVTQTLLPSLRRGETVSVDNPQAHKSAGGRPGPGGGGGRVVQRPPSLTEIKSLARALATLAGLGR